MVPYRKLTLVQKFWFTTPPDAGVEFYDVIVVLFCVGAPCIILIADSGEVTFVVV